MGTEAGVREKMREVVGQEVIGLMLRLGNFENLLDLLEGSTILEDSTGSIMDEELLGVYFKTDKTYLGVVVDATDKLGVFFRTSGENPIAEEHKLTEDAMPAFIKSITHYKSLLGEQNYE